MDVADARRFVASSLFKCEERVGAGAGAGADAGAGAGEPSSRLLVRFTAPQRALTPGQAMVFYDDHGAVVATAPIDKYGATSFEIDSESEEHAGGGKLGSC